MKRKLHRLAFFFLLAATSLSAQADRNERIRTVSSNLMCVCGCHQVLSACNHFNCPSSGPMIAELGKHIDQGETDDQIMAFFVDKYGSTVLAAPPASGFNLAAWVMPFAALGIGMFAAIYFLRRYRSQSAGAAGTNAELAKYHDKVEEELKKFTPED